MAKVSLSSRKKTSRGVRGSKASALQRAVLSLVNSGTTQGQQPMVMRDGVDIPKVSFSYDSTFAIRDDSNFHDATIKVEYLPSPVYCARIWSSAGPQTITVSLTESNIIGDYVYVVGNKLGYTGKIDDNGTFFTPDSDWRQFRCIQSTGTIEWIGPEINRNGIIQIARAIDNQELSTFALNTKADCVTTGVDGVVSVSAQHNKPVFEMHDVDPNDADAAGDKSDPVLYIKSYVSNPYSNAIQPAGNMNSLRYIPATPAAPITWSNFAMNVAGAFADVPGQQTDLRAYIQLMDDKWGCLNQTNAGPMYTGSITGRVRLRAHGYAAGEVADPNWSTFLQNQESSVYKFYLNSDNGTIALSSIVADIAAALANEVGSSTNTPDLFPFTVAPGKVATLSPYLDLEFKFEASKPENGQDVNMRVRVPVSMKSPEQLQEADTQLFIDPDYSRPVVQIIATNSSFKITAQTMFELVVQDDSPFTQMAIATNNVADPIDSLSASDMKTLAAIVKAMPPGLMLDDNGGFGRTAQLQLESRGILSSIVNILRPLGNSILGEQVTNMIGDIAGMIPI